MVKCKCGLTFRSDISLTQHQNAKAENGGSCDKQPTRRLRRQDAMKNKWLREDAMDINPIHVIRSDDITISSVPVAIANFEVVCTYNWLERDSSKASIPGYAPYWQPPSLPFQVQEDSVSAKKRDRNARAPEYPFEIVFRASEEMNPHLSFNDVDVVINRNSLRKLLDFCGGQVMESFRFNLLLVKGTLFVERCESSADKLIYGSYHRGWGRSFEKACTNFPSGTEAGYAHHRVLCYPIGKLRCAVRFEVDACYTGERDQHIDIATRIGDASEPAAHDETKNPVMPQITAAEIKSTQTPKSRNKYLAQLWFGRTPWLLTGRHTAGLFDSVDVFDASSRFSQWETANQEKLRKLATVLEQLHCAVKANSGRNCIAVCEKAAGPKVIEILSSSMTRDALPIELIDRFWSADN